MRRAYVEIGTDRLRAYAGMRTEQSRLAEKLWAGQAPFQMHYRIAGRGERMLLLLHMSGSSSDEFERVGELLAQKEFLVYAPDLPGFGMSDAPACVPPEYLTMEEHCGVLAAFMEAVGMRAAFVYGNMATANLAVHLAVDFPDRVRGLMLAHPLYTHDAKQYAAKRRLPEYSVISPQTDGSHLATLWERSAKYGASAGAADGRCVCLHLAGIYGETLHWALFEDRKFAGYLERVAVPAVVIGYGGLGVCRLQREAAEQIRGGRFDLYEEGTPYIAREEPWAVADMVEKYFGRSHG